MPNGGSKLNSMRRFECSAFKIVRNYLDFDIILIYLHYLVNYERF